MRHNSRGETAPAQLSFIFVVLTTSLSFFMGQLDVTTVTIALPRMAEKLPASLEALQWVVDAYTVALAVAMLSAGALIATSPGRPRIRRERLASS
jgi:MFS family permease